MGVLCPTVGFLLFFLSYLEQIVCLFILKFSKIFYLWLFTISRLPTEQRQHFQISSKSSHITNARKCSNLIATNRTQPMDEDMIINDTLYYTNLQYPDLMRSSVHIFASRKPYDISQPVTNYISILVNVIYIVIQYLIFLF